MVVELTKGELLTVRQMLELAEECHEQRPDRSFIEAAIYRIGAAIVEKLDSIDLSLTHLEAIETKRDAKHD